MVAYSKICSSACPRTLNIMHKIRNGSQGLAVSVKKSQEKCTSRSDVMSQLSSASGCGHDDHLVSVPSVWAHNSMPAIEPGTR